MCFFTLLWAKNYIFLFLLRICERSNKDPYSCSSAAGFGNDFVTFDFNSSLGEATFVHHQNVALEGAEGVAWMDFQEASGDLFMVHDSLGHFEGQPESGVLTRWTRADNGLDWNLREVRNSIKIAILRSI